MDTFTTIWQRLKARASAVDPLLCQDFVRDAFNQLAERREWSWLQKTSTFYPSIFYATGTVSTTNNGSIVTGASTVWDPSFVGAQIRIGSYGGTSYPTYTIAQFTSTTQLTLDRPWAGANLTGAQYQIFQCYFPVPEDFNYFYSIVNTTNNYKLWHNLTQAQLDMADPQRVTSGVTYGAAFYDYTRNYTGVIGPTLQIIGAGAQPVSTTTEGYSFPVNSLYTIQIVTGGASGTATFKWKQDAGAFSTTITTDENPIDLSNGVQVYFPAGTYVTADVFVIQCVAATISNSGVPRYELWPRPINSQFAYPYLYIAKWPSLTEEAPQLPDLIARRGDVVLEMALANCARWPGTSTLANPYYDLSLARQHDIRAETMIYELEKKDDDLAIKDMDYVNWPWAPSPWMDGNYLQSHAWPLTGPFFS